MKNTRAVLAMMARMPTNVFGGTFEAREAHDLLKRAEAEVEAVEKAAREFVEDDMSTPSRVTLESIASENAARGQS